MVRRTVVAIALLVFTNFSAVAFDEASFCGAVKEFAAMLDKDAGTWVMQNVRLDGVAAACGARVFSVKKSVNFTFGELEPNWRAIRQRGVNDVFCNNPQWKEAIIAGWTVGESFTSPTGEYADLIAKCSP